MITIIILSIIFLLIDQISKLLVTKLIDFSHSIEIIHNFFYLTYTHNTGAAFSILIGKRIFLIIISLLVLLIVFNYLRKNKVEKGLDKLAFSLVIGGSLGNLCDRLIRGYVIDFLDFKIFNYNYPIFNIADSFIVIGVILLIIVLNRKEKIHDNSKR